MRKIWIPQSIACVVLLWALNPNNPYGYYIFLRVVCCAVFAYLAFHAFAQEMHGWGWVLGITAVVYNPIYRIHLTREIWSIINLVTIGIAITASITISLKYKKTNSQQHSKDNLRIYDSDNPNSNR